MAGKILKTQQRIMLQSTKQNSKTIKPYRNRRYSVFVCGCLSCVYPSVLHHLLLRLSLLSLNGSRLNDSGWWWHALQSVCYNRIIFLFRRAEDILIAHNSNSSSRIRMEHWIEMTTCCKLRIARDLGQTCACSSSATFNCSLNLIFPSHQMSTTIAPLSHCKWFATIIGWDPYS